MPWNRKNETTKDASLPLFLSLSLALPLCWDNNRKQTSPRTAVGRVIYICFWSHSLLGTLTRQFKFEHHAYRVQGVACMLAFTVRSLPGAVRKPNELYSTLSWGICTYGIGLVRKKRKIKRLYHKHSERMFEKKDTPFKGNRQQYIQASQQRRFLNDFFLFFSCMCVCVYIAWQSGGARAGGRRSPFYTAVSPHLREEDSLRESEDGRI